MVVREQLQRFWLNICSSIISPIVSITSTHKKIKSPISLNRWFGIWTSPGSEFGKWHFGHFCWTLDVGGQCDLRHPKMDFYDLVGLTNICTSESFLTLAHKQQVFPTKIDCLQVTSGWLCFSLSCRVLQPVQKNHRIITADFYTSQIINHVIDHHRKTFQTLFFNCLLLWDCCVLSASVWWLLLFCFRDSFKVWPAWPNRQSNAEIGGQVLIKLILPKLFF